MHDEGNILIEELLWQSAAPLIGKQKVGKLLRAHPESFGTLRSELS